MAVVSDPHKWFPAYASVESTAILDAALKEADAMLLGRRAYEGFAAYWQQQDYTAPLARRTNGITKYVVTGSSKPLTWSNSLPLHEHPVSVAHWLASNGETVMVPGAARLQ